MRLPLSKGEGRILDFDIENMPLTYYAPDYPTALITAIAWAFTDEPKNIGVFALNDPRDNDEYMNMLHCFLNVYNQAEIVTGHYITRHDLPIINGALVETGMPILEKKLVSDTKTHLVKYSALPKTQEFLEAIMNTKQQKVLMTQYDWRRANRFTPDGIQGTIKRVTSDVRGHMQLRKALINEGLLKTPKVWRP